MTDTFEEFEGPDYDDAIWTAEDLLDHIADLIQEDPVTVDADAPDADRNRIAVQVGKARFHVTVIQVAPEARKDHGHE